MTTELDNERRVIDRLFWICVTTVVAAVVVALAAAGDVATALLVIGTNCVTALGVRRTRGLPPDPIDPTEGAADVYRP